MAQAVRRLAVCHCPGGSSPGCVPWSRLFVASLSPRWPKLDLSPVNMKLEVGIVSLRQVFLEYHGPSFSASFRHFSVLSSVTNATSSATFSGLICLHGTALSVTSLVELRAFCQLQLSTLPNGSKYLSR